MRSPPYHDGMRQLQDRFGTRRLADRLDEVLGRDSLAPADREFIESRSFFFLATADATGRPDCSYKGGDPGFVCVLSDNELAFPDYDGNGMFRSLGNVLANSAVGMLFIDFDSPRRLRVNGLASLVTDDPLLDRFVGARLVVRVRAEQVFPNCPRYIPRSLGEQAPSKYVPRPGHVPPEPRWKSRPEFAEVLPPKSPESD